MRTNAKIPTADYLMGLHDGYVDLAKRLIKLKCRMPDEVMYLMDHVVNVSKDIKKDIRLVKQGKYQFKETYP